MTSDIFSGSVKQYSPFEGRAFSISNLVKFKTHVFFEPAISQFGIYLRKEAMHIIQITKNQMINEDMHFFQLEETKLDYKGNI